MNTTHSVVGELISADLDVQHGLPTITLQLRQCNRGYSSQRITALRSYPSTLAGGRMAREHHTALRMGVLYRVIADGIGISQQTGVVYLLGVQDAHEVNLWRHPYPMPDAAEPNSLAAEGACRGLAMSLPTTLQTAGGVL